MNKPAVPVFRIIALLMLVMLSCNLLPLGAAPTTAPATAHSPLGTAGTKVAPPTVTSLPPGVRESLIAEVTLTEQALTLSPEVTVTLPPPKKTPTLSGQTLTGKTSATPTASPLKTSGTVFYVRTDGGTADQCTGRVDAPYPGEGTAQACAWAHPFWALDGSGAWRIRGGDTLIIAAGSYRLGLGSPNTSWCSSDYPWDCHFPPLPSGPDPQKPTQILGVGWDQGCSNPPELWGAEREDQMISLVGTNNAVLDCLEITDHSGCAMDHCNAAVRCNREGPSYGDYADLGIKASDSSNVTLRHLNIHGLANGGILAGRITDWTVEDVRLAANGSVGWNGDLGKDSSNKGTLTFRKLTVEWNGCPESYPGKQPANCWGQELCGGYGDGFGVTRSGGHWVIEDSIFRYNTSDGLDLLYVGVDHPDSLVEVYRSSAYGNAGNQFKIGGASRLVNLLAVGSCAFFNQKPIATDMGDINSGNHCRAGGAAVSINLAKNTSSYLINSTIASHGWADVEVQCNTKDFPDQPACGTAASGNKVWIQNNIFYGYNVVTLDHEQPTDFIGDGDPYHFTSEQTVDYNLLYAVGISSPIGNHNLQADPLFVNSDIYNFDFHLKSGSPAIDSGLVVGSLGGLVPADDLEGNPRPQGAGVDLGAYEWLKKAALLFLARGIRAFLP